MATLHTKLTQPEQYKRLCSLLDIKPYEGNEGLDKNQKLYKAVYRWTQYFRRYPAQLAKLFGLKLFPFR